MGVLQRPTTVPSVGPWGLELEAGESRGLGGQEGLAEEIEADPRVPTVLKDGREGGGRGDGAGIATWELETEMRTKKGFWIHGSPPCCGTGGKVGGMELGKLGGRRKYNWTAKKHKICGVVEPWNIQPGIAGIPTWEFETGIRTERGDFGFNAHMDHSYNLIRWKFGTRN